MEKPTLRLTGNLQIEAALSALRAVNPKVEEKYPSMTNMRMQSSRLDDLKGQTVNNTIIFEGKEGRRLKEMIKRGIEYELTNNNQSEQASWHKVAALALREVLAQENQEAR